MSFNKDLKSKPKKNRFFPLRFGDAVRAVKDLNLKQYDDSRLAVRMENIEGEFKNGFPLFDLVPEEELAIFSLSENLSTKPIHKAIMLALSKASKLKVKPKVTYSGGKRGWIGDSPFIFLDTKKIRSLGWKPKFTIKESIEKTVKYLENNKWVFKKRK